MGNESRSRLYAVDERVEQAMSTASLRDPLARIGRNWAWLAVGGICFLVLGVAAYVWPVISTVTLTLALGSLFLVGGVVRLVQAIRLRNEIGSGWRVFDAILSLAAGVLLLRYPGGGMLAVAIAMTFYFFMSGVTKASVALAMRPLRGSGWALVSAVASLLLGVYMIATFPVSAAWVPGALLGIDFVIYGISLIGLSFNLKNLHRRIGERIEETAEPRRAA